MALPGFPQPAVNAFYAHHGPARAYEVRLIGHLNILGDRVYPMLYNQSVAPQFRMPMANDILGRMAAIFNELERHRAHQHATRTQAPCGASNWTPWRDMVGGLHPNTIAILHNIRIAGPNVERFPHHTFKTLIEKR